MHQVHLPDWAIARGARTNQLDKLDPAHAALIIIDMQVAFMSAGQVFGNPHALDIVPTVNRLASGFRAAGAPVIWTRQTVSDAPGLVDPHWTAAGDDPFVRAAKASLAAGSAGHALHPAMSVGADDLVLDKYRYSAFLPHASDIDSRLKAKGLDTIVIAGTLTNCCCESSARDAFMMGYRVLVVSDATAAVTDEEQNAALLNLRLMFADVRDANGTLTLLTQDLGRL